MQLNLFLNLRRHRLLASFIVLGLCCLIWFGYKKVLGLKVDVYIAEEKPLLQTIVSTGQVIPSAKISLGSLLIGRVKEVLVREGDTVKAGQVVVQLEDREAEAALEQAKAGVQRAEAKMHQLEKVRSLIVKENLHQAELRMKQANDNFERNQQLFKDNAISKANLDDAEKTRDLAKSEYQSALVQSASMARNGSDALLAISDLIEARATLSLAEKKFENTQIVTPVSGVMLSRNVEPGDIVSPGTLVATLAEDGPTRLSVEPDEKNLAYLSLGQNAVASADAFPDRVFPAQINYIAPGINADRGTVEVRLLVPQPPTFLKPYMTVSVEIEVLRKQKTLALPTELLRDAASKKPWVQVVDKGRAQKRSLKIGISGENQVQILQGIKPGDAVIVPTDQLIAEGARVRF